MHQRLSAVCIAALTACPVTAQPVWSLEYPALCGPIYQDSFGRLGTNVTHVSPGGEYVSGFSQVRSVTWSASSDAWLYHNGATQRIRGLTGLMYEPEGPAGPRWHNTLMVNAAGQAVGESQRRTQFAVVGTDSWFYDGQSCTFIGLTGPGFLVGDRRNSAAQFLNAAGQVVGTSRQYTAGGTALALSAWLYHNGTTIPLGLEGPQWTNADGFRTSAVLNLLDNGRVIGSSDRGVAVTGRDWWVHHNGATVQINPASGEFLAANSKREATISIKDDPDAVSGRATTYQPGTNTVFATKAWTHASGLTSIHQPPGPGNLATNGSSFAEPLHSKNGAVVVFHRWYGSPGVEGGETWHYAAGVSTRLGLVAPIGPRFSYSVAINNAGSVLGYSRRYTAGTHTGDEVWLFTPAPGGGGTSISIHPTDAQYIYPQQSSTAKVLTGHGQVVLLASRAAPGGRDALVYENGQHTRIDLSSLPGHAASNGQRSSDVIGSNAAGQVLGTTDTYDAANAGLGKSLWVWDPVTRVTTRVPVPTSAGGRTNTTAILCNDGTVRGKYAQYEGEFIARYRLFLWSPALGFVDLENTAGPGGMYRVGFAELLGYLTPEVDGAPTAALACGDTSGVRPSDFRPFIFRLVTSPTCGPADKGGQGGVFGADGTLDNNDFISFIDLFFSNSSAADVGGQGGEITADGGLDNNDFIIFIELYFGGC